MSQFWKVSAYENCKRLNPLKKKKMKPPAVLGLRGPPPGIFLGYVFLTAFGRVQQPSTIHLNTNFHAEDGPFTPGQRAGSGSMHHMQP